ncbi:S-adenosyl-L-methionine-dependent methyltransferase [Mycena chlorophos]|uniref:S-adenosyl-L-methionine-dependent methyltransferase n=1 Tax=Mycena chlorophos TaxID=658473 RepID=A0A8H6WAW6_MYCCL|nr:S-adenosyl-L-methionine-dependent methyltransferase [Mycena chlorophos]
MVSEALLQIGYRWLDRGLVPDFIIRRVIRALLRQRLREIEHGSFEANYAAKMKWIEDVRVRENIAELTEKANEQHYEVPTKFILTTLGPRPSTRREVLMLESYCEKAQLKDGQDVLDLGCGWGSVSLFLAKKYPNSRIVGLSNSTTQKAHIDAMAKERGYTNLEIITANVNTFDFAGSRDFDRIISIEMLEHMKNFQVLLAKISTWLRPKKAAEDEDSLLFIHIFCHSTTPYHFEQEDGWMAQNFFSGGTMMSHDLLTYFQQDVTLLRSWYVSGTHYSRTLEDWIKLQDRNAKVGLKELQADAKANGRTPEDALATFHRFRVFYMACSELFNYDGGQQWGVGHYLFKRAGR